MISFKKFLIENLNVKKDDLDITDPMTAFYYAATAAEHRGRVKDPTVYDSSLYIRTKARPADSKNMSTAYGPVQITKSTAQDILKRRQNLFDKSTTDYTNQFITQGQSFATAKKGNKIFDYGMPGTLSAQKFNKPYQDMSIAIMKGKMLDSNLDSSKPLEGDDLNLAIKKWRGVGEKSDSEYFKVFKNNYSKYLNLGKQENWNRNASAKQGAISGSEIIPGEDFIKSDGYIQSPIQWGEERYPEKYNIKTESPPSAQQQGPSSQTKPEQRRSSTLQTGPSRPNNTGGKP